MAATLSTVKVQQGDGTLIAGNVRSIDTSGTGAGPFAPAASIIDGGGIGVTVAQFHNADNQSVSSTGQGLLTGGVAQLLNAAGNLDRQRSTGADLQPNRGIASGAAQFAQEVLATSTTSVTAAAATATLSIANTNGFVVGGQLNFEPSFTNVLPTKYEAATITAVVANTSVSVAFAAAGALYTHTQPYVVQTFFFNQERDFSGEGTTAMGIGAAIATEFESNSGGAPLTTGLASGWTLDADRNIQGKSNQQMAISSTTAADAVITFTGNPWTSGLSIGAKLILSATANGAAVEEVIVSKNNTPSTGGGPKIVNIVNPVVTSSSLFATFDSFGLNIPAAGATPQGTEDTLIWLYDPVATDPKRPMKPLAQAPSNPGAVLISSDGVKATYRYALLGFAPVATPTDVIVMQGSATKTIRLKRIKMGGTATAAGNMPAQLIRRSTAGTLGSAVLTAIPTPCKHDINDAAPTAVLSSVGTANYTTLGTTAGIGAVGRIELPAAASGVAANDLVWEFATRQDKAMILRGVADFLCINMNGAAIPSGGVFDFEIETEEDNS